MNTDQLELRRQVAEQDGMDFKAGQKWMVGSIDMETRMVAMSLKELYQLLDSEWEAGAGNCPGYRHGSLKSFLDSTRVQEGMELYDKVRDDRYREGYIDGQWH